jgi:hypothetical protein
VEPTPFHRPAKENIHMGKDVNGIENPYAILHVNSVRLTAAADGSPTVGEGGITATFWPKVDARRANAGYMNVFFLNDDATATQTVILERSFDNGVTWYAAKDVGGNAVQCAAANAASALTFTVRETEPGTAYRFRCTAFTDGTGIYCRASQ